MKSVSIKGLYRLGRCIVKELGQMELAVYASHAAFFLVLSFFPGLLLLLGLLRYTGLEPDSLLGFLQGVIPGALMSYAKRLVVNTYEQTSGVVVGISALTALWSSGRGIHGLLRGLNAVYHVQEDRGYWKTRLISTVYVFLFLLVLLLTLLLHVFGTALIDWIPASNGALLRILSEIVDLRFFLLLFLQTGLFTAMFMVFPNRRNSVCSSIPGALMASLGWLVFSSLFSLYVEWFPRYANVYGSLYSVALSMLWLYICITIVFYGGVLNLFLLRWREKKKNVYNP